MKRIRLFIVLGLLFGAFGLWRHSVHAATTQLPPGEVCFQTGSGPVSNGSLNMFYPGTTTPKPTWQDSGQTVLNTQPISLDANGCAILYGVGTYRQMLFSGPVVGGVPTGNLIFDLPTTDTSAFNSIFWAGTAGGTANAITISDSGFAQQAGANIQFLAIATNTGPTTISISGGTPIPIYKDTNAGPVSLVGGEIGPNNAPSLLYDSVNAIFHLINPSPASSQSLPVGLEGSCPGFTAPTNYQFEFGQAVSRATYSTLLSQLTSVQIGTITSGLNTVSALTDTSQLAIGDPIEGAGIPGGTTIASVTSGTSITMSQNATGNGSATLTFFAYGDGDGTTTFNLPDRRGVGLAGRDNMGGTAAGTLTSAYTTNSPDTLGALLKSPQYVSGGGITISQPNLPNVSFANAGIAVANNGNTGIAVANGASAVTGNIATAGVAGSPATAFVVNNANTVNNFNLAGSGSSGPNMQITTNVSVSAQGNSQVSVSAQGSAASGGTSAPFSNIAPARTTNWCIKVQ